MSPQQASLIDLVAGDLSSYRRKDLGGGRVRFVSTASRRSFEVGQREERRFLGRTTIATFHATHPGSDTQGAIELRHTGRHNRTGVEARVSNGDSATHDLAARIESDEGLVKAILPLDFTRFELRSDESEWRSTVELMGATLVGIALPPIRSYVRLYPDQLEALTGTFAALDRVIVSGS